VSVTLTPSSENLVIASGEERYVTIRTSSTVSNTSLNWESSEEGVALCSWSTRGFTNSVNLTIVGIAPGVSDITIKCVNSRNAVIGSCVIHVTVTK
ncbi:MAG: hypothetical protein ACOX7P_09210, partial [Oscillospiraceae bacterium]